MIMVMVIDNPPPFRLRRDAGEAGEAVEAALVRRRLPREAVSANTVDGDPAKR